MNNQDKMRQQFEQECAEWEMDTSRDSDGDYVDIQTRRAWDLWKAATAYANDDRAMRAQPAPAAQGDALMEFIERVGSVRIQRVRKGFNGPIQWDVEYGYEDTEVHGRTLRDAINAAARAQANKEQP